MKKIFLGGPGSCGVHNEKNFIEDFLITSEEITITQNHQEADLIIITDTCMGTYQNIIQSINYLKKILLTKKESTQVIVSGCLTKKLNFKLSPEYQEVLDQVIQIPTNQIVEYVLDILNFDLDDKTKQQLHLPPISYLYNSISISPVEGCLNNCSFCKSNYMDFSLKSTPLEALRLYVQDICQENQNLAPINFLHIHSSNLSLYGVDLYQTPKTHELLSVLSTPDSIKFISAGALINWYPALLTEILNNQKIKTIFISLESGSERIYNLMNRPISLKKLIEIIKIIRINRPDIIINTEIICGFPTETKDDLNKSVELIYELDINPLFGHAYINSPQIPSSKLPQHPSKYCKELLLYSEKLLQPQIKKYQNILNDRELLVIDKNPYKQMYMVMQINGHIRYLRYDELEREYNLNEIIPHNTSNHTRKLQRTI